MMIHALFVGFCFLCDEILMVLFPSDFLMQGLLFVSNMGFCAIMLTVRKFDWINTCLFAFGFGMIFSVCNRIFDCGCFVTNLDKAFDRYAVRVSCSLYCYNFRQRLFGIFISDRTASNDLNLFRVGSKL